SSLPASEIQASWTNAVACNVCPGASLDNRFLARFRNSSYTSGNSSDDAGRPLPLADSRILVSSLTVLPARTSGPGGSCPRENWGGPGPPRPVGGSLFAPWGRWLRESDLRGYAARSNSRRLPLTPVCHRLGPDEGLDQRGADGLRV